MSRLGVPTRPLRALAEVALGRMRSPDRAEGPNMIPYLRAANVKDGSLDLSDVKLMDFNPVEQAIYALQPGDVLVTEGAGSLAAVGASAVWSGEIEGVVCFQNTLLRLRPRGETDARYLMWWARHAYGSGLLASVAQGANIYHLGADNVRLLPASVPNPGVQRAIAEYLDTETARIDAVVRLRVQQRDRLDEREFALLSDVLVPTDRSMSRLRFMASIQSGLTVDAQRSAGADAVTRPYLRVANVHSDSLALDSVTEITVPRSLAERCTLRFGDVLMTEGGDLDKLGRGTMWRNELEGALHQNHVFAVRPDPRVLNPEYLALLTRTQHARSYFERTGSKTTGLASTSGEKILGLPVPSLSVDEQMSLVQRANEQIERMRGLRNALNRQVDLLVERRQALITASVTGQLEVPGVAA